MIKLNKGRLPDTFTVAGKDEIPLYFYLRQFAFKGAPNVLRMIVDFFFPTQRCDLDGQIFRFVDGIRLGCGGVIGFIWIRVLRPRKVIRPPDTIMQVSIWWSVCSCPENRSGLDKPDTLGLGMLSLRGTLI